MGAKESEKKIEPFTKDEIEEFMESTTLDQLGFYMFEKISTHFEFEENVKKEKREKFMDYITNEVNKTYESFLTMDEDELEEQLNFTLTNHIFSMNAFPKQS